MTDVAPLGIPALHAAADEGETQVVDAWPGTVPAAAPTQTPTELVENVVHRSNAERPAVDRKEVLSPGTGRVARTLLRITFESTCCAWMQQDMPALQEFVCRIVRTPCLRS